MKIVENQLSKDLAPFDNQVKKSPEPLPIGHIIWCLISQKGGGKSTLLLNVLTRKSSPWYKIFDNIYFISPTAMRDHKFDKLLGELEGEGKYFHECTNENIQELIEKIEKFNDDYIKKQEEANEKRKKNKKPIEQPNNLVIFDDCLANLPPSTTNSPINKLFTTSRHLKTSIIITTQKYNKVNPLLRNQIDLFSIFNTNSKREYETIVGDLNVDENLFKRYYDFATAEPFSFLHVNVFGGKPKFFKKFDEILDE